MCTTRLYGERSRETAVAHFALARALLAANQSQAAEQELRATLGSYALIAPPDGAHPASAAPRIELARLLLARHAADEALPLLREATRLRTQAYGADHALTLEARSALAQAEGTR
jgi:hypothetical protein